MVRRRAREKAGKGGWFFLFCSVFVFLFVLANPALPAAFNPESKQKHENENKQPALSEMWTIFFLGLLASLVPTSRGDELCEIFSRTMPDTTHDIIALDNETFYGRKEKLALFLFFFGAGASSHYGGKQHSGTNFAC
jgi:hypothetical protein